jgi:APA family basic amino acid/polyamine antiporter
MARREVLPRAFGRVLAARRTPHVAIAVTTLLAVILISTGDLSTLADTTVLLLLLVFVTVNVSVLVLRRDGVAHEHFRAPVALPVLGAAVSAALMADTLRDDLEVGLRAGLLLLLGVVLYAVNRVAMRPTAS